VAAILAQLFPAWFSRATSTHIAEMRIRNTIVTSTLATTCELVTGLPLAPVSEALWATVTTIQ
jgi:hypothetical protein